MIKPFFMSFFSLLLVVMFLNPLKSYGKETLNIAVLLTSGQQRSIISSSLSQFSKENPDVDIKLIIYPDKEFKVELKKWLDSGEGPDVINWQAGERLYQYVRKNKIKSVDSIWKKYQLSDKFSQGSVSAVTLENKVYGIPISYYQWGFYYRKSTFKKFNLSPPNTWDEFLEICRVLKNNNITPITLGNKNKWPSSAWFDYFDLRINGLDFHSKLLRGEISFDDDRVREVFKYWKQLLDLNYFIAHTHMWKWDEAMPFLYHHLAGMTLIGNFFTGRMPESLKDDFDFFRFPIIDDNVPIYEEAPLDVFMLPHYTKITPTIERFLTFISSTKFQESLNHQLGMIPPNINVKDSDDYFSVVGKDMLNKAVGLSQFFDRDTNDEMSSEATEIFTQFIAKRNIEIAIEQLEKARNKHLLK
ncbi:ABC transporter substrate-binding protein [Pseudocolwellia agarivorans]|uniref:ABC transporter substrate-binding protein n=1 Tax=Pseudocolwellia agarivorans TaxID=1911682 RepID=UPI000984D28F|nr:extracellular solute-binding protein [Pseudocolwellia agarivorans]